MYFQGFVDFVVLKPRENSSLTLRIGRQEMAFGSGRMIDLREGPNIPLSSRRLPAVLEISRGGGSTDSPPGPSKNEPGFFDDPPKARLRFFWGVYATYAQHQTQRKGLDFYYLGLDLKNAVFNQGAGHAEARHLLWVRVFRETNVDRGLTTPEAMYQFGSFGVSTINAWRVAADNWYSFSSVHWRPRIGLATDFASGDKNPA